MENKRQEFDLIYDMFSNLVTENEQREELMDLESSSSETIIDSESKIRDKIAAKHKVIRQDISIYFKYGLTAVAKKQKLVLYLFYSNYVFTKYNQELTQDFKASYTFLNDLFNNCSQDQLLNILYNNPTLIADLIEQYTTIEYYMDHDEDMNYQKNFDNIVQFYQSQNGDKSIDIQWLPNVYQNTALDLELMYEIEDISEQDMCEDIYRFFYINPEEIPPIFFEDHNIITNNIKIFEDEITFYTYIYLMCKEKSL